MMVNGIGNNNNVAALDGAITMQKKAVGSRLNKMQQRQHQGKRENIFSLLASPSAFCSVHGTKGCQCISPPFLDRVHVVVVVM
jgi:hypothetical protein